MTLTDPKSAAALHDIPSEGTFIKEFAVQVRSRIVVLSSRPTYKVRIEVGHSHNELRRNTCLLNTGAGLSIVNSRFMQGDWKQKVKSHPTPKLQSAIMEPITLHGTILLCTNWKLTYESLVWNSRVHGGQYTPRDSLYRPVHLWNIFPRTERGTVTLEPGTHPHQASIDKRTTPIKH